jgi:hypothetical protein
MWRMPAADTGRSGGEHAPRIVGGEVVVEGSYRWVTKITRLGGTATTCTGSLIAERWVLTAAHCILNNRNNGYKSATPASNTEVIYGCLDTEDASCRRVGAVAYVAHPCYTPSTDQDHDDIALIHLSSAVEGMEGNFAMVNGLNGSVTIEDGDDVILAGYGATVASGWGASSPELLQVLVPKVSKSSCIEKNPSARSKGYIDFDNVICTGGGTGKDSCNGDSGGPAIVMSGSTPWLVGSLSIGSELPIHDADCGAPGRVAVYTAVRTRKICEARQPHRQRSRQLQNRAERGDRRNRVESGRLVRGNPRTRPAALCWRPVTLNPGTTHQVHRYSNWIHAVINGVAFCCEQCPCTGPPGISRPQQNTPSPPVGTTKLATTHETTPPPPTTKLATTHQTTPPPPVSTPDPDPSKWPSPECEKRLIICFGSCRREQVQPLPPGYAH